MSPEDTLQRLKQKLEDYRVMGIPEIWVIDPADGSFSRYQDRQLMRSTTFSMVEKNIVFQVDEIRGLLD